MAISRYDGTRIIRDPNSTEPAHYATFDIPPALKGYTDVDWFQNQPAHQHVWQMGDRLDKLSSQFYGDDNYGWLIALVNKIPYQLGITAGTVIRIPADVDTALGLLNLR